MREGLARGFAKNLSLPYAEAYDKMIQSAEGSRLYAMQSKARDLLG